MQETITLLNGVWTYDPEQPLGSRGGFGQVFLGTSKEGNPVAIKRLHPGVDASAHREFLIANDLIGKTYRHIITILDFGELEETGDCFIVMERADHSLHDHLDSQGILSDDEARDALLQIANGLREIKDIVHRDLKPRNILFHEDRWKIADFGISRLADKTTSSNTLKTYGSEEYAAPEQWRGERATQATDVYALGCIGHTLLSGRPPFGGPDFREQHLSADPPNLEDHAPALRSLMADMLRKVASSRPSVDRIISRLTTLAAGPKPTSPGLEALARAGAKDAERVSSEEAKGEAERNAADRRHALAKAAMQVLETVVTQLFDEAYKQAPTARTDASLPSQSGKGYILGHIWLGGCVLTIRCNGMHGIIDPEAFPLSKWDVIVGATIEVEQFTPRYVWAASLWYTNLHSSPEYRWYEVAYCTHVLSSSPRDFEPFALTEHDEADEADKAATIGNHLIGLAYDPKPIDDDDVTEFISRWAGRLAQASAGELRRPNLPLEHRLPIAMRSW